MPPPPHNTSWTNHIKQIRSATESVAEDIMNRAAVEIRAAQGNDVTVSTVCVTELEQDQGPHCRHVFNAERQRQQPQSLKASLPKGWVLVTFHFAENYSLWRSPVPWDKPQRAHWAYKQVTVFSRCFILQLSLWLWWTRTGVNRFVFVLFFRDYQQIPPTVISWRPNESHTRSENEANTLNEKCFRIFWKKSGEWTIRRKMTRQKEQED